MIASYKRDAMKTRVQLGAGLDGRLRASKLDWWWTAAAMPA